MKTSMGSIHASAATKSGQEPDVGVEWVSSVSQWYDPKWIMDNAAPGSGATVSTLSWDAPLIWGGRLTDSGHETILALFKHLAWSLFSDRRGGNTLSASTAGPIGVRLRYMASWMIHRDYDHCGQLDNDALELFIDDLSRNVAEKDEAEVDVDPADDPESATAEFASASQFSDEDDGLGAGTALNRLLPWSYLWRQRSVLAVAGFPVLSFEPFPKRTLAAAVRKVSSRALNWIPPLPDEVASPIMEAAQRILGTPAEEVIAAQRLYNELRRQVDNGQVPQLQVVARRQELLSTLTFTTLPGESKPWHPSLSTFEAGNSKSRLESLKATIQLRQMIDAVRDAAVIMLQSSAGQRIGELCSLKAGMNEVSGFPSCIEKRRSRSGLLDLFFLKGILSKTVRAPVEVEWLIGSRPANSDFLPPPVRAVQLLQELFAPWRVLGADFAARSSLIVASRSNTGLPWTDGTVTRATNLGLLAAQRGFVSRFVDLSLLPDQSRRDEDLRSYRSEGGQNIRSHQWRKSFALFVFRSDNTMIPALAQQFKHLSLAMTEQSYIGNDPSLVASFESVILHNTVDYFLRSTRSSAPRLAGRFAETIDKYRGEIAAVVEGKTSLAARSAVESWVLDNDFRIWFGAHGKCFVALTPTKARCHELAGTDSWSNRRPNYAARETNVCAGCSCYAVDGEHTEYWLGRYTSNQGAWLSAVADGDTRGFQAIKARADQAAAFLRALGVGVPVVEAARAT